MLFNRLLAKKAVIGYQETKVNILFKLAILYCSSVMVLLHMIKY
jgi:hypothetical protein